MRQQFERGGNVTGGGGTIGEVLFLLGLGAAALLAFVAVFWGSDNDGGDASMSL